MILCINTINTILLWHWPNLSPRHSNHSSLEQLDHWAPCKIDLWSITLAFSGVSWYLKRLPVCFFVWRFACHFVLQGLQPNTPGLDDIALPDSFQRDEIDWNWLRPWQGMVRQFAPWSKFVISVNSGLPTIPFQWLRKTALHGDSRSSLRKHLLAIGRRRTKAYCRCLQYLSWHKVRRTGHTTLSKTNRPAV